MAKGRKPRLGRGLSSLVGVPEVSVDPPEPPDPAESASNDQKGKVEARLAETSAAAAGADHTETQAGASSAEAQPAEGFGGVTPPESDAAAERGPEVEGLRWIDVEAVEPNRFQPRRTFDPEALEQLASSIRRDGIMQPIIIRSLTDEPERWELVAGERRWRAAQKAGLAHVPALVRQLDDQQLAEWAVIENLQREDLNPIERAQAFARLIQEFSLSHEQVGERVGIGRPTITNTLRLLDLPDDVQRMVQDGALSGGAGRALLGADDEQLVVKLADQAVSGQWSVRKIEEAVRASRSRDGGGEGSETSPSGSREGGRSGRSAALADVEEQLGSQLQTRVQIRRGRRKGSGTIAIEFYDLEQFESLLEAMNLRIEQ